MVPTADLLNALFTAFLGRIATPAEQTEFVNKISYSNLIPILNDNNAERNAFLQVIAKGEAAGDTYTPYSFPQLYSKD